MASQAATSDIEDILLSVVGFHLLLVMAAITINRCGAATMARAALPTRAAVVHREGMVRNRNRMPVIRVMALRTLPLPVIRWPVMARGAVGLALVAERGRLPGVGVMAGRALPAVVVGRTVRAMAGAAVGQALVTEACRLPGAGVVTG